jgi:hypothetical protein
MSSLHGNSWATTRHKAYGNSEVVRIRCCVQNPTGKRRQHQPFNVRSDLAGIAWRAGLPAVKYLGPKATRPRAA